MFIKNDKVSFIGDGISMESMSTNIKSIGQNKDIFDPV